MIVELGFIVLMCLVVISLGVVVFGISMLLIIRLVFSMCFFNVLVVE